MNNYFRPTLDALKSNRQIILWGFGVWTFLALLTAGRNHLTYYQLGYDVPLRITLLSNFVDYYLWGLASIVIFRLSRRFPIEAPRGVNHFTLHLVLSVVFTFLIAVVSIPVFALLSGDAETMSNLSVLAEWRKSVVFRPSNLYQGPITYWATVAVAHAVRYYRRAHDREIHLQRLAAQLADAKLNALKMQIHPHFLFNTLNSISALLHRDVDKAEQMIAYLGDFLRLTLSASDDNQTTLQKEFAFLETYLKIEKIRFSDRLQVAIEIAPETQQAIVPLLIMQPLVENTIRHGFANKSDLCRLEISAQRREQALEIIIKDNGEGLSRKDFQPNGNGVGLRNTQLRLRELYQDDFSFEIRNLLDGEGTLVRIETPFITSKN